MNSESTGDATDGGVDRYVHRPEDDGPDSPATDEDGGLGRTGWVLVAIVVFGTIVVPGAIYLAPQTPAFGEGYFVAYIALPMVPALLLGATAVWSMTGARERRY